VPVQARLLLDLLPALALGLLLQRRWPRLAERLAPPLVQRGVPLGIAGLLLRAGLQSRFAGAGLLALLACGGLLLLLHTQPSLRRWLPVGSLRLGAVMGNTAYVGLPVALALLPPEALGYTIGFDLAGTVLCWTGGPLVIGGSPLVGHWQMLQGNPAVQGVLLALVLGLSPWGSVAGTLLWWPARLVVLLGLVLLGARLGALLRSGEGRRVPALPLALALLLKLLLLPLLLWLLAGRLPLEPVALQAVVLQGATPPALSVLLQAEAAGEGADAAAAVVLLGTLLSLLSLPLWGWLLTAGALDAT
jgi:malate permease and related proteins